MLPDGARFLRDCNRCTGARAVPGVDVVDVGAGLAEVAGALEVVFEPVSPPLLPRAAADDAPRREPALGGMLSEVVIQELMYGREERRRSKIRRKMNVRGQERYLVFNA
jgi:hypothetical protein